MSIIIKINMNKKIVIGVISLVVLIGAVTLYIKKDTPTTPVTPQQAKIVNLGAVLAMSGYAAADGEDIKNGIELAKTDLAKNGVTLNVDYFDDATDPTKTLSGINLLTSKGIKLIMGPTWGFQVTAALPVIENKDVALFLPAQASDNVLGLSSKAFFAKPSTAKKQAPTEAWLKQVNAKKVAVFVVIFSGDNWSDGHLKTWTSAVKNSGAELTMVEKINLNEESDITQTLLLKAKQKGVDTILWTGTDGGAITLIKKMQEMNLKASVLGTTQIEKVISTGKVTKGNLALYALMGNTSGEFAKKFASVYGADKRFDYAEGAYDLTMIAAQEAVSNTSSTGVADYIKKNINYSGFGGSYTFDTNGDRPSADWKIVEMK